MKKINYWFRNYFGFSKTESNGFVILIPLMLFFTAAPALWRQALTWQPHKAYTTTALDSLVAELDRRLIVTKDGDTTVYGSRPSARYTNNERHNKKYAYDRRTPENKTKVVAEPAHRNFRAPLRIDLNTADTTQFKKVYGIGRVLSARIVKYRDLLGGFVAKDQLKQVYGLNEDVLHRLDSVSYIADDFEPKKISIGSKSYILDDHPYISKQVAKAIEAYQFQHGSIPNLEALAKLQLIDSVSLQKISPYLSF